MLWQKKPWTTFLLSRHQQPWTSIISVFIVAEYAYWLVLMYHCYMRWELAFSSIMGIINIQNDEDGFSYTAYINRLFRLHLLWQFSGCISNWFVTDGECRIYLGIDLVKHIVYCMHHLFNINKSALANRIYRVYQKGFIYLHDRHQWVLYIESQLERIF